MDAPDFVLTDAEIRRKERAEFLMILRFFKRLAAADVSVRRTPPYRA